MEFIMLSADGLVIICGFIRSRTVALMTAAIVFIIPMARNIINCTVRNGRSICMVLADTRSESIRRIADISSLIFLTPYIVTIKLL